MLIQVALNTKLCCSSKDNMAGEANRNIKEVFTLLKEPIRERTDKLIQEKNNRYFGLLIMKARHRGKFNSSMSTSPVPKA